MGYESLNAERIISEKDRRFIVAPFELLDRRNNVINNAAVQVSLFVSFERTVAFEELANDANGMAWLHGGALQTQIVINSREWLSCSTTQCAMVDHAFFKSHTIIATFGSVSLRWQYKIMMTGF